MKRFIKIVSNCCVSLLVLVFLSLLFVNFTSKDDGVSKIGRYSFFNVDGDSMYPKIKDGDFIAINRNIKEKYNVGDVVSFYHEINEGYIIVTHKIVYVEENDNSIRYVTKGVNNKENDEKLITGNEIIGEYTNFRIPLLGYVVEFARTNVGYLVLIVIPLGLVLLVSTCELLKELEKRKKGEV